ncbi:MAG: hypothetical protein ACJ76I_14875 [Gaiellaceae bacterium]
MAALACAAVIAAAAIAQRPAEKTQAAAVCSRAAASQAIDALHMTVRGRAQGPSYVHAVLCGAFAGRGSSAMAATTGAPPGGNDCLGPLNGWFVFRNVTGGWQILPGGAHLPAPLSRPLTRSGNDLTEQDEIHGNPLIHCDIAGLQERTWHWNGSRLVASGYQFVMPTGIVDNFNWFSPDRQIWCSVDHITKFRINDISCATKDIQHGAMLKHTGALRICDHPPGDSCTQNWGGRGTPLLQPSQHLNINGFHCASQTSAMSCTVATGPARGKGFRLTSAGQVAKL